MTQSVTHWEIAGTIVCGYKRVKPVDEADDKAWDAYHDNQVEEDLEYQHLVTCPDCLRFLNKVSDTVVAEEFVKKSSCKKDSTPVSHSWKPTAQADWQICNDCGRLLGIVSVNPIKFRVIQRGKGDAGEVGYKGNLYTINEVGKWITIKS